MAWWPNGDMLVTERGARRESCAAASCCRSRSRARRRCARRGKADCSTSCCIRNTRQNHDIYPNYAKPNEDGKQGTTAVTRAKFENDKLSDIKEIFVADAWSDTPGHFGARMAFDKNGYLFLSVGDRMEGLRPEGMDPTKLATHHAAPLLVNHQGKILAL